MPTPNNLPGNQAYASGPSILDVLSYRAEKVFLANLDTGDRLDLVVNPAELRERYAANYARLQSPGLSHEPMQYTGSPNAKIPLVAFFDQILIEESKNPSNRSVKERKTPGQRSDEPPFEVEVARRFMISLVTPRRGQRLKSVSPPPVLFVWPGMIEMRVRVTDVEFGHVLFEVGRPRARAYTVSMGLEEAPLRRITSEDVFRLGTFRPWAGRLQ